MVANFNQPVTTDNFADVLSVIRDNQYLLASWENSGVTGTAVGAKRWSDTNARFEEWNGSGWAVLAATYNINVSTFGGQSSSYYRNASNLNAGTVPAARLPTASTSGAGISQLSTSTSSTSTTQAATPSAVKSAYDLAAGKAAASHGHNISDVSGLQNALDGKLSTGGIAADASKLGGKYGQSPGNNWDVFPYLTSSGELKGFRYLDFYLSDTGTSYAFRIGTTSTSLLSIFNSGGTERFRFSSAGTLQADGDVVGSYSDMRLKTDIESLNSCLAAIQSWRAFTYSPNKKALAAGMMPGREIGLSAQDIAKTTPEAVRAAPFDLDSDGNSKSGANYQTIRYERLVPVLVGAIQELVDDLAGIHDELERQRRAAQ